VTVHDAPVPLSTPRGRSYLLPVAAAITTISVGSYLYRRAKDVISPKPQDPDADGAPPPPAAPWWSVSPTEW
jgi:hypothetical protein